MPYLLNIKCVFVKRNYKLFFVLMILVNQLGFAQNYPGFSKYWGPIHEEFNKQNYYAAYDLILQRKQITLV